LETPVQTTEFGYALLFIVGGLALVGGGLFTSWLLAPQRPNPEKLTSYECGEEPVGGSWGQLNNRFYAMGLIFLLFDVEIVLLFPWAMVVAEPGIIAAVPNWGWFALVEGLLFMAVLAFGLVYVWARGDIDWVRPNPLVPETPGQVPLERYLAFNVKASQAAGKLPAIVTTEA
jgi:NADH-quinone oxidoreductase subunit A